MLAWGGYIVRLLLRSLHMLQLEDYQTLRFLRWSLAKPERWARLDRALLAVAALVAAATTTPPQPLPGAERGWGGVPLLATWAALGVWLGRGARFGRAKKPLVLTARAKRLLAGEVVVATAIACGPAAVLAFRDRRLDRAMPALWAGVSLTSLCTPPIAAAANLLLWPLEEGFRRYYLDDARRRLRQCGPTVVAVAGSYGKTSTKEFLATILSRRWSVLKPPGSHNTPMGLSRVVREQLEPRHELFVAELGDYGPGEIRSLCELIGPRIGVLTTIGPEHLERFKSMERIVQAKGELFEALPTGGVAVVNQDDPLVRMLGDRAEQRGLRVVRYGYAGDGNSGMVQARDVRTTREGLVFTVTAEGHGEAVFEIGVLGRHNVANVLAATAVGLELGMALAEIAEAVRQIAPVEHRLQPIRGAGGVLVIDDTFNSNPRGAAEALEVLAALEGGRRVLVTPGMVELGEREFEENRAFGHKAAAVCDEVILVGRERARPLQAGLHDAGYAESQTHVVGSLAEATARLQGMLRAGDIVLFENDLPDLYDDTNTDHEPSSPVARGLVP
ncbi:MAG: UDP-N-acetylmuramoyl-tripeptide--D-alanyl-D-alanine ligase, partial [Chloroflexi bacterium]|nr:UDP-N-acetylmuramoyl-tripeptide--D-alanyl-D-alanine ligase [Chloroflexota bacterium]